MFIKDLKESFHLLIKNPVIYLPDLFEALVSYILIYLLYIYTGASNILPLLQSAETFSLDILTSYISENFIALLLSVIIFIFVTFFLGVGIMIFKFTLIKDIITHKKAIFSRIWKENNNLFFPIVLVRLLLFVINFIVFGLIILLSLLIYYLLSFWNPIVAQYIAISIGGILLISAFILITLVFFFRYPIIFLKNIKHPIKVLQTSLKLFSENYIFVILTALVILALNLVFSIFLFNFNLGITTGITLIQVATLATILSVVWSIISLVIQLTAELWGTIYLFLKYSKSQTS